MTREIIGQLDELLETGFGGVQAQNVNELIEKVAHKEYETDVVQRELLRELLAHEQTISYGDFFPVDQHHSAGCTPRGSM